MAGFQEAGLTFRIKDIETFNLLPHSAQNYMGVVISLLNIYIYICQYCYYIILMMLIFTINVKLLVGFCYTLYCA